MFLSTKILTKLMKDAYKVSLKVGCINNGIMLQGATWFVWLDGEHIPNKIKALVVEFAGGLPENGKMFEIGKKFPSAQYIIADDAAKMLEGVEDADQKLNISPIIINHHGTTRLLQTDEFKNIVEVNEEFIQLIDKTEIDFDIEGEPTGPCYDVSPYSIMYWYNDICLVGVLPKMQKFNPLFTALQEVDFDEKILTER